MKSTLLMLLVVSALPAAAPDSGLKPGDKLAPYSFLVSTGPQRGQPTCYVCDAADKPVVILFARTLSEPLGKLANKLDLALAAQKPADLRSWLTLTAASDGQDAKLVAFARQHALKALHVGVFDDVDGPPAYKLHRDADVTVVIARHRKAVKSLAFRVGELNEKAIAEVVKAVAELK